MSRTPSRASWLARLASFRGVLDAWFGTIARYAGLLLLLYAAAIDRFRNPALIPAATGLMFLKNVAGGKDKE